MRKNARLAFPAALALLGLPSLFAAATSLSPGDAGSEWERAATVRIAPNRIDADAEVARLTPLVKKSPESRLGALAKALAATGADDFERVRAIHDWVSENIAYDFDGLLNPARAVVAVNAVISRGKSVCDGYSHVFQALCSLAGIDCVVVTGHGRGYGFDPFAGEAINSNHAWNAVRINGGWYLVDTTWDAGYVDLAHSFHWRYSGGYLFVPPQVFICTHYPSDPAWQLLKARVEPPAFKALPQLFGYFGTAGFEGLSPMSLVGAGESEAELLLRCPPGAEPRAYLRRFGSASDLQGSQYLASCLREGEELHVRALFPEPGRYELDLVSGQGSGSGDEEVARFYFQGSGSSKKRVPYIDQRGRSLSLAMEAERGYEYLVGGQAELGADCPAQLTAYLVDAGGRSIPNRAAAERVGDRWTLRASFPAAGSYLLCVAAQGLNQSIATIPFVAGSGSDTLYPYLNEGARAAGLAMEAERGYSSRVAGTATLSARSARRLGAFLLDKDNKYLPGRAAAVREGELWTLRASFPGAGSYLLCVSAEGSTQAIATLSFTAASGGELLFPYVSDKGRELGLSLDADAGYQPIVTSQALVKAACGSTRLSGFLLDRDKKFLPGRVVAKRTGEVWTIAASLPAPGAYTLCIAAEGLSSAIATLDFVARAP